ncbi:MAG: SpoIIE family protein phosphatase [Myxococcota bacterium]
MRVQAAHSLRPCPGFTASGDVVITRQEGARALLAVIDALGHGPEAAIVAAMAEAYLSAVCLDDGVEDWLHGLHDALAGSRGAAAGLARIDDGALSLSIVGNIAVRSCGTRVGVVASPGIVGRRMRRIRRDDFEMRGGDRVALFSDGLRRVELGPTRALAPDDACARLLEEFGVRIDDASILLADFHDA